MSLSWKEMSLRAKDERRTPVADEPVKKSRAKKNTRKWCGGHRGREHKYEWLRAPFDTDIKRPMKDRSYIEVCATCGRINRYCFNMYFSRIGQCVCGLHPKPPLTSQPCP